MIPLKKVSAFVQDLLHNAPPLIITHRACHPSTTPTSRPLFPAFVACRIICTLQTHTFACAPQLTLLFVRRPPGQLVSSCFTVAASTISLLPASFCLRDVPTSCPRTLVPPLTNRQLASSSFHRSQPSIWLGLPQVVAVSTEVDRVRLVIVFDQNGCNVIELEGVFLALLVAPESGLMPSSRVAHRTWNNAQLLGALVSVHFQNVQLARFLFLCFR